MRKLTPYILAATALLFSSDVYAQSKKPDVSCKASAEIATSAPWYNLRGPKLIGECDNDAGKQTVVYVPLREEGGFSNNMYFNWQLPRSLTGNDLEVEPLFEHSEKRGNGAGVIIRKNLSKNVGLEGRAIAMQKALYGELKFLTRYIDLDFGAKKENGVTLPYFYATTNFGEHSNTITFGMDADRNLWNNFSLSGEKSGIVSITYYNHKTENWTTGSSFAFGGKPEPSFFTTDIARFIARQDINPKESAHILLFPSHFGFSDENGGWSGELRADHTGEKTFAGVNIGKAVRLNGIKIGAGAGVQYIDDAGKVSYSPTGELFLSTRIRNFSISVAKRFRREEGNTQVTANYVF